MQLPDSDAQYMEERHFAHSITEEAGAACLVIPTWPLPDGYTRSEADLLVRLYPGYPDVAPDMWWFSPEIQLADGRIPPATEVREYHVGREWQRWSRHFNGDQWRSGVDGLESFFSLIRSELQRCANGAA